MFEGPFWEALEAVAWLIRLSFFSCSCRCKPQGM